MGSPVGEVQVLITGDYSQLETALQQATVSATTAGAALAEALTIPDGSTTAVESFETVSNAAVASGEQFALFGGEVESTAAQMSLFDTGAIAATESMVQVGDGAAHAGAGAIEASEGFSELTKSLLEITGITLTIEALKDLASESIEAFSRIQNASVALTAMSGSAAAAAEQIEGLEVLANHDALGFPSLLSAAQRMTAFGMSAESVTQVLGLAADAAAATGNSFDAVSSSLTRVVESGAAGTRQLTQLGITVQQLAAVMGVSATEVAADFKAMDPTDRINVISQALQKFSGDAQLMTNTVTGQLNELSNAWDHTAATIGSSIGPIEAALAGFASYVVSGFGKMWADTIGDMQTRWMDLLASLATGTVTTQSQFKAQQDAIQQSMQNIVSAFATGKTASDQFFASMAGQTAKVQEAQNALANMAVNLQTATGLYQSGKISLDVYNTTVDAYGKALDAASTNGVKFSNSLLGIEQEQSKSTTLLNESLSTLQQATPGTADYAKAIQNVGAAWDAANPGGVKFADTLMGIQQQVSQQAVTFASLSSTFAQVSARFEAGSVSANLFLTVAEKLASAAAAMHTPFASVAVDVANISYATDQAAASSNAAIGAFNAINDKYHQGEIGLQALIKALNDAQTAAKNAGTSFSDAAAEAAKLSQGAQLQIQAFKDDVAVLGQFKDVVGQTPAQAEAAITALKNLTSVGQSLGIEVTAVAGAQNAFNISTSSTSPAVQGLVQQLVALFTQQGLTATATITGTQATAWFTTTIGAAGVPVQTFGDNVAAAAGKVQTLTQSTQALGPMAQAAANALLQVNGLGTAAKNAADTGLDPFSAAAVAAHVSMDNYTGSVTGASGKLTDVFSPAAVAASVHINEYTGQITNASGELGGPFSAAVVGASISIDEYTGKVQSSTGAMTDSTAAAKEYAAALDNVSYAAQDAAAASGKGGGGGGDASGALAGFAGFLSPFSAGLLKNFVNTGPDPLINSGGTADAVAAVNLELEKLSGSYGQIYSGAIAATDPLINFGKVVTAASTATTSSTAATTSATTAVVAYTGATTTAAGAMSDLPLQIDPVTGAIISLGNASSGTANMIAYGTSSLGSATSSASTAVANLGTSVSNGSLTWDQFIQGVQGYTQQIDQGTISLTDGTAAMGALAQQALNAAAALQTIPGSGGGVAGPAQANLLNPNGLTADAIQKAWNTYNQATDTISQGLSTVTDGTVQAASTQQTTFAAYQKAADTLNQTLGVMAASASGMTSNIGGLLTNGEGQGPASYNAQTGTYTVSQTVQGETFTAQGQNIQAAQAALSQLLLHSQNPFGTAAPGSGGQIGQSAQGTNYAAYALPNTGGAGYSPQTPSYTHANPLPVSVTNSVPPAITINISGVGQTSQQVAQSVQQSIITTLRQAGLKI